MYGFQNTIVQAMQSAAAAEAASAALRTLILAKDSRWKEYANTSINI